MQTTPEEVLKEINRIFLKGNGGGKERQDQVLVLLCDAMGLPKPGQGEPLSLPLEAPKTSKTKKIKIAVDFTWFTFVPTIAEDLQGELDLPKVEVSYSPDLPGLMNHDRPVRLVIED